MGSFDPEEISVGPKSSIIVVVITLILGGGAAALAILAMLSSPQVSEECEGKLGRGEDGWAWGGRMLLLSRVLS